MTAKRIVQFLCALALLCGSAFGQNFITGTLQGIVTDPSNAAVPNVQVEAKSLGTGVVRTTITSPEGIFVFNSMEAGRYSVTIKAPGFKTYAQNDIVLNINENRDLGRIGLSVGAVTEEISVTAVATPIQTASSENSKLVDSDQMVDLTLKGRDMFSVLATVPGVNFGDTYFTGGDSTDTTNGPLNININGVSNGYDGKQAFEVDGVIDMDTGANSVIMYEPTMDSIAEIRVMTTNYQAEYGRNSGGTISVVTKGGSSEFHGTLHVNKRHEMFNAKSFFQNYNGQAKSLYRYFVWGYSIGGPVAIPKLPHQLKKKLFFFVSQEYTRTKPNTDYTYSMVATAAQRAGNFAGYANSSGTPVTLLNPTNGKPLTGNNLTSLIGTSAYDPASAAYGQAMMNFFPLPNLCNAASGPTAPAGCITDPVSADSYTRNRLDVFPETYPRHNTDIRIDYNPTTKLTGWFRWISDYSLQDTSGSISLLNSAGQTTPYSVYDPRPGHGYATGITYTINPTTVNEFTFGKNFNSYDTYPRDPTQLARANMGNPPSFDNFATDPNFTNDLNNWRPEGLPPGGQNFLIGVPQVSFGGGQEPNETGESYLSDNPYTNFNDVWTVNDAVSKTWHSHNFKVGAYFDYDWKRQREVTGAYTGSYSFSGSNAAMPANTQDGFANAWLGNFNTYSEGQRLVADWTAVGFEAFAQDNWRVSRRLTLDLGVRFYHDPPVVNIDGNATAFYSPSYNPASAERIYYPGCSVSTATAACPTADQYSVDPATGYKTFFALNGTLVPASVGGYSQSPTPFPGMQVMNGHNPYGIPKSMYTTALFPAVPRIGFAWDVFGNGRTALRGGIGQFLNRGSTDQTFNFTGQAPTVYSRSIYFDPINQIPNFANSAAITPIGASQFLGEQKLEGTYDGSLMIQQNVGFSTVLEASYVFNLRRHIPDTRQLNAIPIFGEYNPSWASPLTGYLYANASGKDLSDNYFLPYLGLGAITESEFEQSTDYSALQVTVRRNMTRHLSYGFSYTLGKTMSGSTSPYWADKFRNWGPSFAGSPSYAEANYVYEAPNLGQKLNFKPLGWVTDHWTVSGITSWRSDRMTGVPGISLANTSTTNASPNFTGSAEGARMMVEGNPELPSGQVSFVGGPAVSSTQGLPGITTAGYGPNGTPGNQILNESAFVIPYPCSYAPAATPQLGIGESMECFGNAGAGSIVKIPHTRVDNWDMTFAKNFPIKSEKRVLMFRAEMYNIFNHTQYNGWNTSPSYDWNNWKNGVYVQTNNSLGRFTSALNPRQMSMSLQFRF